MKMIIKTIQMYPSHYSTKMTVVEWNVTMINVLTER